MITSEQAAEIFGSIEIAWDHSYRQIGHPEHEGEISATLDGAFMTSDLEKLAAGMRKIEALRDGRPEPDEVDAALDIIEKTVQAWDWNSGKAFVQFMRADHKERKEKSRG
jgi:hypothetical protein